MTMITEPTTRPAWIGELVPVELRQEGQYLLEQVESGAPVEPLLDRIRAIFAEDDAIYRKAVAAFDVEADDESAGPDAADGLAAIIYTLTRTLRLNTALDHRGYDPDILGEPVLTVTPI